MNEKINLQSNLQKPSSFQNTVEALYTLAYHFPSSFSNCPFSLHPHISTLPSAPNQPSRLPTTPIANYLPIPLHPCEKIHERTKFFHKAFPTTKTSPLLLGLPPTISCTS